MDYILLTLTPNVLEELTIALTGKKKKATNYIIYNAEKITNILNITGRFRLRITEKNSQGARVLVNTKGIENGYPAFIQALKKCVDSLILDKRAHFTSAYISVDNASSEDEPTFVYKHCEGKEIRLKFGISKSSSCSKMLYRLKHDSRQCEIYLSYKHLII
jgi:hypothetical protein